MASTNQSPFYQKAEAEYQEASTDEERIACLEVMIRECPKHKSSESMLSNLKNRLRRLKEGIEKRKNAGKSSVQGIKKSDMQCILAGFPTGGKSTIFNQLTGLSSKTSPYAFTTLEPKLGIFLFEDAPIQLIDCPSFPNHDKSLINATDTILLVVRTLEDIKKSEEFLYRTKAKIILVYNHATEEDTRKIQATLLSKYNNFSFQILKAIEPEKSSIEELKKKIYFSFPVIRVYTKEPKKEPSKEPMILKLGSTVSDASEKILKGMSKRIKRARIWGPSSKFSGQSVGLEHVLKDKDAVEFQTS